MNNVEQIYNTLLKKYRNSKRIFIALNVASLLLAATVIVLNIFAIRFNPVKIGHKEDNISLYSGDEKLIMWLFIALAIMSASAGFLTSFLSFFVWRRRAKKDNEKVQSIQEEVKLHKAHQADYQDKDRDSILIEKVTKIRNS